ncbi:hypothetical protein VTI28DRAFT_8231 [Corynascus sepedonium]
MWLKPGIAPVQLERQWLRTASAFRSTTLGKSTLYPFESSRDPLCFPGMYKVRRSCEVCVSGTSGYSDLRDLVRSTQYRVGVTVPCHRCACSSSVGFPMYGLSAPPVCRSKHQRCLFWWAEEFFALAKMGRMIRISHPNKVQALRSSHHSVGTGRANEVW